MGRSDESGSDEGRRARQRATWPIRKFALGEEPDENLSAVTTGEERLAMMWELSRRAWLLSGRPMPDYERATMPGRVLRNGR